MLVGSGRKVSASSGVLGNMVQCTFLRRERCLGYMVDQGDVE